MQGTAISSPSWTQIAFWIVASFIGGGGAYKLFNIWLNRKKPASEIVVNEAEAVKRRAEARKINAEADIQFTEIVERLHVRIEQMQAKVEEICVERDECRLKLDLQFIELTMRDKQIKRMKGIMDANDIKMSDFDVPKEKP